VLVACWHLDDAERRDALLRRAERLHAAFLANWAFHDGRKLEDASRELDATLDESPDSALVLGDVVDAALEHLAAMRVRS
jgi:predicted kinase